MKNKENILWGIILIIIGILFLGNNLNWWSINIFFKGWWTLFIIIPSIRGLFDNEGRYWSIVTLALGILMLLACNNIINWNMIWKILLPIIFVVVGLSLILKNNKKVKKAINKNSKNYVAFFSGIDEKIKDVTDDFRTIAIFGGIELDLSKSKIEKDIVINAVTVFGGIDLKIPDNVNVVINGLPIFGGVEKKSITSKDTKTNIYLNYTCVFGGIDIL